MGRLSWVLAKEDNPSLLHEEVDKENKGMAGSGKGTADIGTDIEVEPGNTVPVVDVGVT